MKKLNKILFLLLTIMLITQLWLNIFCQCRATDAIDSPATYKPTETDDTTLNNKIIHVISIITNIGMVTAVITLGILGIKYMIGSIEEKAEYKKDLLPYFVGAVLLFGINFVIKIAYNFGQQITLSM